MIEIYFDTEFTSLESLQPSLISIGCVTKSHGHYYAEVEGVDVSKCSQFVIDQVLPLLDSEKIEMHNITLALGNWIESLKEECILVTDAPYYDLPLFCNIFLTPGTWPENLRKDYKKIGFKSHSELLKFHESRKQKFNDTDFRQHHALDDAIVMMNTLEEFA